MKTWKTMIAAAAIITILTVSGATIYYQYFARRRLIVSTTTSLYETGLLDIIKKEFETKYPVDISLISAGTGIAIQHAEKGDADIILVHSPSMEKEFLQKGVGVNRKIIAYNFFVIVGPKSDPAQIKGKSPIDALKQIADYGENQTGRIWVSRGDNSGTHSKEKSLWQKAGYDSNKLSKEPWYANAGAGMGATLMMTNEFSGYTLTDMGTYLAYSKDGKIGLKPIVTQGKDLLNVYSVIAVVPTTPANKTLHSQINFQDSIALIKYLTSEEGQRLIENHGKAEYGQSLFYGAVQLLKQDNPTQITQWIKEYAYINGTECPQQYRYNQQDLYT